MSAPDVATDHRRHRPLRGIAFTLCNIVLVASLTVTVKWVGLALPTGEVVFVRSATAMLVLLLIGWRMQALSSMSLRHCLRYVPRTMLATLSMFTWFAALSRAPLANVIAVTYTAPIFATIFAAFTGERVQTIHWLVVAAGFTGTLIVVGPHLSVADASAFGLLLALASATSGAWVRVVSRDMNRMENPIAISFYFAFPTTLAAACTAAGGWTAPDLRGWLGLGLIGLIGSAIQIVGNVPYRYAQVATLAPLEYLGLVVAVLAGYLIFDEVPEWSFWAGAPLLILAGLLMIWAGYRSRAAAS